MADNLNITNIPAPRVPFIDERTGLMAREWYRFFLNLFVLTGSGSNPTTLDELQIGPPNQPDLAELLIQVNQNIAPQYEDQSGDFLATLDTAQLMSMMARFENLEAAIQGAYLNPPSIPTDGVYVPYTNATANVDLNAKTLTNVSHVGINTTTVPTTLLRAFGDNNTSSRISVRGYSSDANSSSMRVTKFRGTYAAPQAPFSGDSLGKFELAGYGTTSSDGYAQASFEGVATENWGATARGSKTLIKVTPNTTTTQVTAVTIDQDKSVTFATTASATTFIGALTGTASGNLVSGGALGTPSSGTVTNLTGTASININGTVGATTPTTGAFTTLSATGDATLCKTSGNITAGLASGAGTLKLDIYDSSLTSTTIGANRVARIGSNANGGDCTLHFTDSVAYNSYISAKANHFYIQPVGGTSVADFSSTGLAVTGTLSATGVVTFSNYGVGTATFNGSGVISSVSDETWKVKDGAPVDTDVMINKLEPGYWYYNDEKKDTFGADRQLGFYAQNVNAAIGPEAAPEPEEGKPWGYYDRSVLAVTVMSLQKALATIESLTERITALETK